MCGIFGRIRLDRRPVPERGLVAKGVELMRHRGPDDAGVESAGPVTLGHARLAIIDLPGGHQPMYSDDRRGLIVYNGELYNYRDLRRTLERVGRRFLTDSDTEVLLAAYLEWGHDCLSRLRGIFAFCAVDLHKNRALLARDRLGVKPLFYTGDNGSLTFSSELEPLYRTLGPFKLDQSALDDYLGWQYIHAPKTIYRDVVNLPPAHYISVDLESGQTETQRYWRLEFREDSSLSIDEWEARLDHELKEAVEIRLMSDVPFGAFLSGGIDSGLVVGYMADIMEQPAHTFSIGFNESRFNELPYADKIARINNTEHKSETVDIDSFGLLSTLVRHYGQPFADASAIPTHHVAKLAASHVKMVLSGDGGDENFAGYEMYEHILRRLDARPTPGCLLSSRRMRLGYHFLRKLLGMAPAADQVEEAFRLHSHSSSHFSPAQRRRLFNRRYRGAVASLPCHRRELMSLDKQPLISRLQHLDLMTYLPFDILTKVDTATMANSLEARVPLLDHKLVETSAIIPARFKMWEEKADNETSFSQKHILKRLAYARYPKDIVDRPKMGFGVPLGAWFAGKLKPEVERRLLKSRYLPAFFERDIIRDLLESHSEKRDLSTKLWNLLFLEEWMRSHSDAL